MFRSLERFPQLAAFHPSEGLFPLTRESFKCLNHGVDQTPSNSGKIILDQQAVQSQALSFGRRQQGFFPHRLRVGQPFYGWIFVSPGGRVCFPWGTHYFSST